MRLLKWFFLLSKRLYKKWMFLVLICLIPLSVLALKLASAEKAGFAQIAVVNPHTEISDRILETLNEGSGILNFLEYESADDALADLSASRLDAVWVLPEDLAERFAAFVNDPKGDHYIVKVYRQEDSLVTRLALEKLSAAMFPYTSRMLFLKCMREDAELDLSALTDEEILGYYDRFFAEGTLFTFAFPDGVTAAEENERNYLTSPIRGLLSVVVLLAGSAIDLSEGQESADAILLGWYPGAGGGRAVAELLFGKESPSGKLPVTFYRNSALGEMPAFTDYSMKDRTYRYYQGTPLYPFGYGLSYGKVSLSLVEADRDGATVCVKNEGERPLEEVIELYLCDENSPLAPLNPILCGFQRVRLGEGEEKRLVVPIDKNAFTVVDEKGRRIPGSGSWRLWAGFGAPDKRTEELTGRKAVSTIIK